MSAFGVWLRAQRRRFDATGRAASLVDAYEVEAWDDTWASWESAVLTAARTSAQLREHLHEHLDDLLAAHREWTEPATEGGSDERRLF